LFILEASGDFRRLLGLLEAAGGSWRLLEAWELVNSFGATQVFGKQVRRAHHCIFSM
jgi:hypothetical protein